MPDLRVLDFGRVSPLRSQTLWHAIAHGVSRGAPPTLSFMRPSRPYVCLGWHRRIEEADIEACREAGLPVFRRMVGGGVVYLDAGQQFFQITVPARAVPPARAAALRHLLGPAVEAFRAAGVPAQLDDEGEIVVGEAPGSGVSPGVKVCGHGAGQIEDAVVVVGNLIESFDHEAAARILRLPEDVRLEVLRLMRRYVAATPADPAAFRAAAASAYGDALGLAPAPGRLTPAERVRLRKLDRAFCTPEWVRGSRRPEPGATNVKVRAGVWVCCAEHEGARAVAGVVRGRIERARVSDPELNGAASAVEGSLVGLRLDRAGQVLTGFGPPGQRLAAALAKAQAPA